MMSKTFVLAAVAVGLLTAPAYAHHSFAMFDSDQRIEMEGTVKELRWTNPHVWLFIFVTDNEGQTTEWGFEMGAPAGLVRAGWAPRRVRPGDRITVIAHPMRSGVTAGQLLSVTLPDGQTLGDTSVDES